MRPYSAFEQIEIVSEVRKGVPKKTAFNWTPFSCSCSSSLNCTKYVLVLICKYFEIVLVHFIYIFYINTVLHFVYLTSLRLRSDMLVNRYFEVETLKK